jgi:hypothetical protein
MATLVQLAAGEPIGIVVAPFILIALLHRVCALWRYWAASRTYVARHAAARADLGACRARGPE